MVSLCTVCGVVVYLKAGLKKKQGTAAQGQNQMASQGHFHGEKRLRMAKNGLKRIKAAEIWLIFRQKMTQFFGFLPNPG